MVSTAGASITGATSTTGMLSTTGAVSTGACGGLLNLSFHWGL